MAVMIRRSRARAIGGGPHPTIGGSVRSGRLLLVSKRKMGGRCGGPSPPIGHTAAQAAFPSGRGKSLVWACGLS